MLFGTKNICNFPKFLLRSPQSQEKKIQETNLYCVYLGRFFMLSNRTKLELPLLSASRNANQRTFFFRQPSLEVSLFLAVRRGREWQGVGKHSDSSGWSSVSKCFRNSHQWKHVLLPTQRQVKRQLSKSALDVTAEAQSEGGGGEGRTFESLPLVSLPKASASGTSMECETKSFSS